MNLRLTLLLPAIFLMGCKTADQTFDDALYRHASMLPSQTIAVSLYDNGKLLREKRFKGDSPNAKAFIALISDRSRRWRYDRWISYAPEFDIASDGLRVNASGSMIIVNMRLPNGRHKQFVSSSPDADTAFKAAFDFD
ncbi:MAG TPA: hypothetical protein VD994_02900 [Prosthecobacter sp.]|nr:hypothetical protein [Prosthecobacter sp.]